MAINKPFIFVGIGGTGGEVGRVLERNQREELCGPDGTALMARMRGHDYLPYQLPAFQQFVYGDLNMDELTRTLPSVVPSAEHHAAARQTTSLIANLVPPNVKNSDQLSSELRVTSSDAELLWVPPAVTDPRIGPLTAGAGQLPTVARLSMHYVMRQGNGPSEVLGGVSTALERIKASGPALHELGGRLENHVDVFVAFSVAGGTGCGIFLDYIYLIGNLVRRSGAEATIYPLVLLPSAFTLGMGGGRPAVLNGGAALVDLFRLVDDQNAQSTPERIGHGSADRGPLSIRVPGEPNPISLAPSTVPTALLFGRPDDGVSREDLIRSMVSLMTALLGVRDDNGNTFIGDFINSGPTRSAHAATGIGRRGVSTAAVASLTIPTALLVDVASSRLLADAVREMRSTPIGTGVLNRDLFRRFDKAAGLGDFPAYPALDGFAEVEDSPKGYDAIVQVISGRGSSMKESLVRNERLLAARMGKLAKDFDPAKAAEELLGSVDPFQLRRVMLGNPGYVESIDQGGFDKVLANRTKAPRGREGFGTQPPRPDALRRPRTPRRLRWTDPAVQEARQDQDDWYAWQIRCQWHSTWAANERIWSQRWRACCEHVRAITDELVDHVAVDSRQFDQRAAQLYAPRNGVSYLLPPDDDGLPGFYRRVFAALIDRYRDRLGANPTAADIVTLMLGDEGWRGAYRAAQDRPEAAVRWARERIRVEIADCFRPGGGARSLIPAMRDLLAASSGRQVATVDDVALNHFRQAVAGVVPAGYAPAGEGRLKVLISYPAGAGDPEIESHLRATLLLPQAVHSIEFRPVDADSLSVVLFRSGMGITEVPEAREALLLRSQAMRHERPEDKLAWRQRLGVDSGYVVASPDDRAMVLQGFLCAMWNGLVETDGADPDCPRRITVRVGHADAPGLVLDLTPFRELSSWASLLQAYEEWVLSDGDNTRRLLAERLINTLPRDVDREPRPPASLYTTLNRLPSTQLKLIEELRDRPGIGAAPQLDLFEQFWARDLPTALDLPFRGVRAPFADLRGMTEYFDHELRAL